MWDHPFSGHALCTADAKGRLRLPSFIVDVLERRSAGTLVMVGIHEVLPCLTAFDRGHLRWIYAESERLRLRFESSADSHRLHAAKLHRLFGMLEEAPLDAAGHVRLSPVMRRLGRIGSSALIVGTGGAFEIWDPEQALESGDPCLRELAGLCAPMATTEQVR